ncbi:MAG: PAS domain-containing protein [Gammaproteobacteria bacterium]
MSAPNLQSPPLAAAMMRGTTSLHEACELMSRIMEHAEDRVFVKDAQGRYRMANAVLVEFFGRPREEILGRTDWDLLPYERARFFVESDQWVFRTGECTHYELDASVAGRQTFIYTSKAPIRDANGQVIGVVGIGRDITARKKVEEALRLSETRFAAAQAIAHLGSWEWNLKTNRVVWSDECYRIFGVDPANFHPTYPNIARRFHANDVDRFRHALAAAVAHGTEFRDDFRIVRPNGEERHLHVEGVATQYDADGTPLIMTGTNFDITERKRTEIALRRSESNFAHAQRIAQVGSWAWVPSTGQANWSQEACRMLGIELQPNSTVMRTEFLEIVHPEDRAAVSAAIDATLAHGVPYDLTLRILHPRLGERIIHTLGEMRHDSDNRPVMTGVCQDITESRRLHEQLRSSEAHLAQAQRIARMASSRWDMRTGREAWSAEIHEILGTEPASPMSHRRFLEFVDPPDRPRVAAAFNPMHAGAAPYALDFRITTRDGRERFISSLGEAVVDESGTVTAIIGILQDITERKRIEGELAASRDELRDLMRHLQHVQEDERRHIAREIHDEFGAVFTAANLSLYRLANQLQEAPAATRELLASTKEMIANAGRSLDDIVNGLHPQMLNHLGLAATLEWYAGEFEKRTGIRCARALPDDIEGLDEQQAITLFRCLQESLTNVAKHAGAEVVRIRLAVGTEQITLSVADDGKGFAPESLAAADAFGIRGLGARVAQLGGTFKIQNQPPRGTRVLVTMPRQISPKERIP